MSATITITLPDSLRWRPARHNADRTWAQVMGLMLVVDEVEGEERFGEAPISYSGWIAEDEQRLDLDSAALHAAHVEGVASREEAQDLLWSQVRALLVRALDELALSVVQR